MSHAEQDSNGGWRQKSPAPVGEQLLGAWALLSYTDEQDGQPDAHPFGITPQGVLIYTADGFVSAQLMNPTRAPVRSADWHGGDPSELAQAAAGYIAYCGRYEVNEEQRTITHIPSVALLPNLIGVEQHRTISLDAGLLTLQTEALPSVTGGLTSSRLEWTKIPLQSPADASSHTSAPQEASALRATQTSASG